MHTITHGDYSRSAFSESDKAKTSNQNGLGSLLRPFIKLQDAWVRMQRRRATRYQLMQLSDRQLQDIGLRRADLDKVIR